MVRAGHCTYVQYGALLLGDVYVSCGGEGWGQGWGGRLGEEGREQQRKEGQLQDRLSAHVGIVQTVLVLLAA